VNFPRPITRILSRSESGPEQRPHGYACEYNELFDNPNFGHGNGPHVAARQQLGRISIANSDAEARVYVDGAIDAANRAVNEQL
jgi:spermidine dehydrogenase